MLDFTKKIKALFAKSKTSTPEPTPEAVNEEAPVESSRGYLATDKDRTCPYCGAYKNQLELLCYYSNRNEMWSDLRNSLPQVAVPSLVQKCPICGKHYVINAGGVLIKSTSDFEFIDPVTWDYFKESYYEFDKLEKESVVEFNHRFRLLGAYNDEFSRYANSPVPTDEDFAIFKDNMLKLIGFYEDTITRAEFYREIGMFDECLELLSHVEIDSEGAKAYIKDISDRAKQKDMKPFGWLNEE